MTNRTWRSILSLVLAFALVLSTCMTIFAETTIIENEDGTTTERTTIETPSGTGPDYSVTIEITEDTTGTLADGSEFESHVETTETVNYDDYYADNGTSVTDGHSKTTQTVAPDGVTVDVPLTEGGSDSEKTEVPDPNPKTEGDEKTGEDDTDYDYTVTTVTPGTVTVTTTEIESSESTSSETDMDYVSTDTTAAEGTDLFITGEYTNALDENGNVLYVTDENGEFLLDSKGNKIPVKVPVYYGVPDPTDPESFKDLVADTTDGYGYTLVGTGNSSQFYPCVMFRTPGFEGELPSYTAPDGTKYYSHRGIIKHNSYRAEGVYLDGEKISEDNIWGIWGNVAQYVLIDGETGEPITTYCADQQTYSQDGFSYNIQNLEDAGYYTEEQAEMIRTVANNGYWGVKDDPTTPEAEYGSLAAMKQMMADAVDADGNPVFTQEEIDLLSDGIAMTATQFSIWSFSNAMEDVEFLNCHWIPKDADDIGKGWSYGHLNNIPTEKESSVALIFKLYEHLTNMAPTKVEKTSDQTVYTADQFLDNINLTVMDKVAAEDHVNNQDDDKTNDAYYTTLTFALVVAPAERDADEPQDDLLITLYDSEGNTLAKGRIAGELGEGEIQLIPDENNNYSFNNVIMTEGNQQFSLNLTGVQYLDEGIYLYSSEIRPEDMEKDTDGDKLVGAADTDNVSSQTMVGVAGGAHGLNVALDITFNVNVEDEVIVTERFWHTESSFDNPPPFSTTPPPEEGDDPPPPERRNTPPSDEERIPDDPVPMNEEPEDYEEDDEIEILDEEVPLAEVPETGDASDLLMLVMLFSIIGLIAVNLPAKKRFNA